MNPNSRYQDWKPKEQYTAGFSHVFSTEKIKIKTKLDGFKEKIEGYKDLNIVKVVIEEPLLNSNNIWTVGTLLRYNSKI